MTRILLIPLALMLALATVPTTQADSEHVTLIVSVPDGVYTNHFLGHPGWEWQDTVTYSAGMTALDLLEQVTIARDASYTAIWYDIDGDGDTDDAYIDEIDGVRSDFTFLFAGAYWALYDNDNYATTGAAGLVLEPGDTVTLRFEGYPAHV